MTNTTINKIILSATTAMFLTACGGGGGDDTDKIKPDIKLNGSKNVTLTVGDKYTDAGATVTDNKDKNLVATVGGNVNTAVPGTYIITYNVKDAAGNKAVPVKRTVTVKIAKPDLADAVAQTYTKGSAITELTFTNTGGAIASCTVAPALPVGLALDANNCKITGTPTAVTSTNNYTVTAKNDTGEDSAIVSITVNDVADTVAPIVTASESAVTIPFGGVYTDKGATVTDNSEEHIIAVASGEVDVNTAGEYIITYTATDSSNNSGTATTTVTVSPRHTVNDNNITDTLTGLVWDKTASLADSCVTPKTVPTIEQFQTIIDYTKSAPAVVDGFDLATDDTHYKTSDGWDVSLKYGNVTKGGTATKTICVDATSEVTTTRVALERNATTNTVTDPNTGLVWADTKVDAKTLAEATDLCTGEMRLPTVIELDSIYDRENNKTVAPFKKIHNGYYWTSTEGVAVPAQNWTVAFDDVTNGGTAARIGKISGQNNSSGTAFFRCVKKAD
jgi:hypothetical protein